MTAYLRNSTSFLVARAIFREISRCGVCSRNKIVNKNQVAFQNIFLIKESGSLNDKNSLLNAVDNAVDLKIDIKNEELYFAKLLVKDMPKSALGRSDNILISEIIRQKRDLQINAQEARYEDFSARKMNVRYSNELFIVASSGLKIWDTTEAISLTNPAYIAYKGNDFKRWLDNPISKRKPWLILSPKYGYIEPYVHITNYNVTFEDESTKPVTSRDLRAQIMSEKRYELPLNKWKNIFVVWNNDIKFFNLIKDSFNGVAIVDFYDNFSEKVITSRPPPIIKDLPSSKLIKILIDGSNVALDQSAGNKGKIANILLVLSALEKLGFNDVRVVCDASLLYKIDDTMRFKEMIRSGQLIQLPAKTAADEWILKFAQDYSVSDFKVKVITNDTFRDWALKNSWVKDNVASIRVPFVIIDEKVQLMNI